MTGVTYFKNNQQINQNNIKYKVKYRRLRRVIKNYVFENAALCDQIAQIQENIAVIKEERRFLLKKLLEYEHDVEMPLADASINNNIATAGTDQQTQQQQPQLNPAPAKRGPKKRSNSDASAKNRSNAGNASKSTSNSSTVAIQKRPIIQTIAVDAQGRPVLPIYLGNLTIHSLGDIAVQNKNFYTENWMYPIGYVATRIYAHPKVPERKCTFTCKILDNSGTPQFQIIPDADFDHVFFGESANICHLNLLETIVRVSDVKNLSLRPQGEIFFGLGHSTVISLLQSMQNVKKCPNFKGFHLENTGGSEEKDPTLNFDALQKLIAISVYHTVPEIKEEPPDELLE